MACPTRRRGRTSAGDGAGEWGQRLAAGMAKAVAAVIPGVLVSWASYAAFLVLASLTTGGVVVGRRVAWAQHVAPQIRSA